jgi:hypothetical protein
MKRRNQRGISRTLGGLILLAVGVLSPTGAAAARAPLSPQIMLRAYFAALNAHHYYAAWALEAPCGITIPVPNGPGAPMGSEGYAGRGTWQRVPARFARHPILASAHVTAIKPLHIPLLARHHVLAFGVSGRYTFDYSLVPWANMKHRDGFHVVKIALWQCHGRWGIEPAAWLVGSGGELTWS